MKIFDKVGQEITVGSIIAYGHALGRCAGLRIGKVLSIKDPEKTGNEYCPYIYSISVIGVDDDWEHSETKLCERKGTLMFPNRILVLADKQVPKKYRELLNNYTLDLKN